MNPITFTDLPQDLVSICASYLPPPELRRLAQYEPPVTSEELRGEHSRVLEIWSRFRTSYDSAATWDLQAGIDPTDVTRKGTGRKVIEERYRAINAVALPNESYSVPQPDLDPFATNARLQGQLIRKTMAAWNAAPEMSRGGLSRLLMQLPREFGAQILVQAVYSPVYELDADRSSYVLSEEFYDTKFPRWVLYKENPPPVSTMASSYELLVQTNWRDIYTQCVEQGHERLCREYGGFQNLEALDFHLTILSDLFLANAEGAAAATATAAAVVPADMATINLAKKRLEDFEDHFHKVITSCSSIILSPENAVLRQAPLAINEEQLVRYRFEEEVRKFLFSGRRAILNLPHSGGQQRLFRLFKEELVQRNILTATEVNQRGYAFDNPQNLQEVERMVTDYVSYLQFLAKKLLLKLYGSDNSSAAKAHRDFSAIDEDEDLQHYITRLQRLFKEVIPFLQGEKNEFLLAMQKVTMDGPSCQATCTIYTLLYQEIRRNGLCFRYTTIKFSCKELQIKPNLCPALVQLIKELAAKEEASSKASAAAE